VGVSVFGKSLPDRQRIRSVAVPISILLKPRFRSLFPYRSVTDVSLPHPERMISKKTAASRPPETVVGWREWVQLPSLGVEWVKAKVDTGARTSSLHAFGLEEFSRDGVPWVRFAVHPWQRSKEDSIIAEAPLFERRSIRSSNGRSELRPVIQTMLRIGQHESLVDLTLTRRDDMGFRMLLGREAIRGRFLVDSGRSYIAGRPAKSIRVANQKRS